MELYQELFSLEAEFSNFRPGECVDLGGGLEDEDAEVSHGQGEGDTFMVLDWMHLDSVQFTPASCLQQIQISLHR